MPLLNSTIIDIGLLLLGMLLLVLGITWGRWQVYLRTSNVDAMRDLERDCTNMSQKLSAISAQYHAAGSINIHSRSGNWQRDREEEHLAQSREINAYIREHLTGCAVLQEKLQKYGIELKPHGRFHFTTAGALGFEIIDAAKAFNIAASELEDIRKMGWRNLLVG